VGLLNAEGGLGVVDEIKVYLAPVDARPTVSAEFGDAASE